MQAGMNEGGEEGRERMEEFGRNGAGKDGKEGGGILRMTCTDKTSLQLIARTGGGEARSRRVPRSIKRSLTTSRMCSG